MSSDKASDVVIYVKKGIVKLSIQDIEVAYNKVITKVSRTIHALKYIPGSEKLEKQNIYTMKELRDVGILDEFFCYEQSEDTKVYMKYTIGGLSMFLVTTDPKVNIAEFLVITSNT